LLLIMFLANNQQDTPPNLFFTYTRFEHNSHKGRTTYIYFGPTQPTPEEINFLKQTMPGEIVTGDTWF
ncbi:hypothetical protein Lfee_0431, partial [Legionella feeleii]